jgi:hypothetical protein
MTPAPKKKRLTRTLALGAVSADRGRKIVQVTDRAELDKIEALAKLSAARSLQALVSTAGGRDPLRSLWRLKVDAIGCDPMNADRPLNLIEQLNQTFTYIASVRAARILLELHPLATPFTLNLGNVAGQDIASDKEGGIAAEVFAAVSTSNNEKLKKDLVKVSSALATHKYVFYMCPGIEKGLVEVRGGVQVWSVGSEL